MTPSSDQSQWRSVLRNPSLWPRLSTDRELPKLKWHPHAHQPNSSQVMCVSLFGGLRHLGATRVVGRLVQDAFPAMKKAGQRQRWDIDLEHEDRDLLNEHGGPQPTSVDALVYSSKETIAVECKLDSDARDGFGQCSQAQLKNGTIKCHGFYGPGSDRHSGTGAWCRLEHPTPALVPRLYWVLGRSYFRPEIFQLQTSEATCPYRGPSFQLMRNFLTSATLAAKKGKAAEFGVLAVCPQVHAPRLQGQLDAFREEVVLAEHRWRVRLVTYERMIEVLSDTGGEVAGLGDFLDERLTALGLARR